ncbi:MAG: hypothetical protein ACI814_001704 [Mariniblastus sp.]|jgi:hypothetical protein
MFKVFTRINGIVWGQADEIKLHVDMRSEQSIGGWMISYLWPRFLEGIARYIVYPRPVLTADSLLSMQVRTRHWTRQNQIQAEHKGFGSETTRKTILLVFW